MDAPKNIIRPELDIDPAFLDRLSSMGGDQLVVQLIQMYFQRSAELMENIQAGVASNDLERSKAAAHSLISSSGNLGGQMVSYLSKLMEHFAFERESAPLAEIVEKLKRSQADFIEYLKNDLEKR